MAKKPALTEKERRHFQWEFLRRNTRYKKAYQEYLKDPDKYGHTQVFVSPHDPKDRIEINLRDISQEELGRVFEEIRNKYNVSTVEFIPKAYADWTITNGNRLYDPDKDYDPGNKDHPFARHEPARRMSGWARPGHIILHVEIEAPLEEILKSVKGHVRKAKKAYVDKQKRERRAEKMNTMLEIHDKFFLEKKKIVEISRELNKKWTTVKMIVKSAWEEIYGDESDDHKDLNNCPICLEAKSVNEFCPKGKAMIPSINAGQIPHTAFLNDEFMTKRGSEERGRKTPRRKTNWDD